MMKAMHGRAPPARGAAGVVILTVFCSRRGHCIICEYVHSGFCVASVWQQSQSFAIMQQTTTSTLQ